MKTKIYAAYGSNINTFQMSMRCPNARVFGQGMINGYKLAFYGRSNDFSYATILPCADGSVPVLLWKITPKCERQLDIYEGFPETLQKRASCRSH